MTTRLKTIQYAMPTLTNLSNNTLTAMTQRTIYIPEFSGTVTFRSVIFEMSVEEGQTTAVTSTYFARRIDVSVGGAAAVSLGAASTIPGAGENLTIFHMGDATTHFVTNWTSGTSKTLDVSVLVNSTAIPWIGANINVTCYITFEYDDTQTTQVKTVFIPLNAPTGALATTKPGTATATIPALDTELPESSKVYRDRFFVVQGNIGAGGSDADVKVEVDTLGAYTSYITERSSLSDRWSRIVINSPAFDTTTTHSWFLWASHAYWHHQQAWMVVTYEFDASASTDVFVSVMLPVDITSPMGGPTAADYQRSEYELWIEEPGTITTKQIAFFLFWEQVGPITGVNMRVGTGSFVPYSDSTLTLSGGNGAMVRNDAAFSLVRGKNRVSFDVYRTDPNTLGQTLSGFWIINYIASKPSQGYGAANHTVLWNLGQTWEAATAATFILAAIAPVIPETSYFLNGVGTSVRMMLLNLSVPAIYFDMEKTSGEGNVAWLAVYHDGIMSDQLPGPHYAFSQIHDHFRRWSNDPDTSRLDIEIARRWRGRFENQAAGAIYIFSHVDMIFTYHTISFAAAGNVTGSSGGTVNLYLHRVDTGELVATGSRSGNGTYSLTWYDNAGMVFVEAFEDGTHVGRSTNGLAA